MKSDCTYLGALFPMGSVDSNHSNMSRNRHIWIEIAQDLVSNYVDLSTAKKNKN